MSTTGEFQRAASPHRTNAANPRLSTRSAIIPAGNSSGTTADPVATKPTRPA